MSFFNIQVTPALMTFELIFSSKRKVKILFSDLNPVLILAALAL